MDARLQWLCRRGMKELDVLLQPYLTDVYPHASPKRRQAFAALLNYDDPEIIERLFYGKTDADCEIEALLAELRRYQ